MHPVFRVTYLHQKTAAYQPLLSGVSFGGFNRPLFFRIEHERFPAPVEIAFVIRRDKDKKPLEFAIEGDPAAGFTVTFYNPTEGGASGLTSPFGLLLLPPSDVLGLMFVVDVLRGSETYRLTYEFSHGTMSGDVAGGAS